VEKKREGVAGVTGREGKSRDGRKGSEEEVWRTGTRGNRGVDMRPSDTRRHKNQKEEKKPAGGFLFPKGKGRPQEDNFRWGAEQGRDTQGEHHPTKNKKEKKGMVCYEIRDRRTPEGVRPRKKRRKNREP